MRSRREGGHHCHGLVLRLPYPARTNGQTVASIMGAILKQLVGRGDIPEYIREAFQTAKRNFGSRGPRLPDLMEMVRKTIVSLPQVFICLDALDECLPKHLPDLLGSLRDIVQESPKTRIFLTGRPHIAGISNDISLRQL